MKERIKHFATLAMLFVVALCAASCSDDDDEGGKTDALRGSDLIVGDLTAKEYIDGEYAGEVYGFRVNWQMRLKRDGTVSLVGSQYAYAGAAWKFEGNDIVVSYLGPDGSVAQASRFIVEDVYDDFGCFVLRLNLNEEGTHYYRIACEIDSQKYEDTEWPDWWMDEW